jgi:hypothetical protein
MVFISGEMEALVLWTFHQNKLQIWYLIPMDRTVITCDDLTKESTGEFDLILIFLS